MHSGRKFENETVQLDGNHFVDCEFIDCTLIYSGGQVTCTNCHIHPNTVWAFKGQAEALMNSLRALGWDFSFGKGPVQ